MYDNLSYVRLATMAYKTAHSWHTPLPAETDQTAHIWQVVGTQNGAQMAHSLERRHGHG